MEGNQGPHFHWAYTPIEQEHVNPDHEVVVNSIKKVIHTIINSTFPTPTTTVPETTQIDLTQTTTTTEMKFAVNATGDSVILTEIFQNNDTVIPENNVTITEMDSTNNSVVTAMEDVVNTTSSAVDTLTNIVDTMVTTTESAVATVTEAVTSMMPSTSSTMEETLHTAMEQEDYIEDKTLYIVLGVILGTLIVIMIILLVIYRRYKSNFSQRAGVYCVTDLNQVKISHQQKEIIP